MNETKTPRRDGPMGWTVGGRPLVPTTIEGRLALIAALLSPVPIIGWSGLFGAPIFLFLALRRGDRGLLLVLPLLVGLFFVVFVVAEFTVGHD